MLIFMIPSDSKNIRDEYQVLLNELEKYNPELLDKPRLLVVTKTDLLDEELKEEISRELPHVRYHFISAIANIGLVSLNDIIWNILNP
jgi:GTP-binding protein